MRNPSYCYPLLLGFKWMTLTHWRDTVVTHESAFSSYINNIVKRIDLIKLNKGPMKQSAYCIIWKWK